MPKAPLTITLDPNSELAHALDDADEVTIILESKGTRYTVKRADDDIWAGYDPEKVRAALKQFAGTLTPEEGESLKELIYRGREEGTRPLDRP